MKFRIHMSFIDVCVVFVPRNCNKPAHELAALGVGVAHKDHLIWTTFYPNSIIRLVTCDLAVA
jgi:hypothetical protein